MLKLEWKVQGHVLHYMEHISVFEEGPHKLGVPGSSIFLSFFDSKNQSCFWWTKAPFHDFSGSSSRHQTDGLSKFYNDLHFSIKSFMEKSCIVEPAIIA